jgi:hypothetical protein
VLIRVAAENLLCSVISSWGSLLENSFGFIFQDVLFLNGFFQSTSFKLSFATKLYTLALNIPCLQPMRSRSLYT